MGYTHYRDFIQPRSRFNSLQSGACLALPYAKSPFNIQHKQDTVGRVTDRADHDFGGGD
jgi:hypothetical protein